MRAEISKNDNTSRVMTAGMLLAALAVGLATGFAENTASLVLISAMVIGIVVLPALVARPVWSVYLTFASSMIYFSTSVAGQVLSPVRVFGLTTVGIWVMTLVSQPRSLGRLRSLVSRNRIAQGMLLLAFAAVTTFLIGYLKFPVATRSPQLKFSPVGYVQQIISYVSLFFATIYLVDDEHKVTTLLKIMVWASLAGLAYASVDMLSRGGNLYFLDALGGSPTVRVRITQWYQILTPFLVVWLLSSRTRLLQKFALSLAIGMLLLGMLLSATRSAFLSIAIQLFLYTVWYPRKLGIRRTEIVLGMLVLGLSIFLVVLPRVPSRFRDISFARLEWMPIIGSEPEEFSRIPQYLDMASIYIKDLNWFTGIGFGHFEAVFHYEYVAPSSVGGPIWTDAHSLLITLPFEMGILGIVVLYLYILGVWAQLRRALVIGRGPGMRNLYELSVGCTASFFSLMPSLLFQGPPLLDRNFYFIMAVISALGLLSRTEAQKGDWLNKPRNLVSKASDIDA